MRLVWHWVDRTRGKAWIRPTDAQPSKLHIHQVSHFSSSHSPHCIVVEKYLRIPTHSAAMASVTASIVAAPVVALSASTSTSATSSRTQLSGAFLKSRAVAPLEWANKTVSNGSRVNAFNVVDPNHNFKFETLSYLPPLTDDQITKQVDYLLRNGWVACIEFDKNGTVSQTALHVPGYYDGRYWSMWKLPLFGAKDASQVLGEVIECKKAYPEAFIRVIGFDNVRQVQIVSFLVKKPDSYVA